MAKKLKRIWHPWYKWECFPANFFGHLPTNAKKADAEKLYAQYLADVSKFEATLKKVTAEWAHSCEHNLTNESMNRIAWLGQACLAYEFKLPSQMRAGFNILSQSEQAAANLMAEKYLNKWLSDNAEKLEYVDIKEV
jgi:hypothetical protein